MRFLSVCSGIEAASVAWKPLGWTCSGVAEVEPFPCHVLHHRYGASRPMFMPQTAEDEKERRRQAAAIRAVAGLPEMRPGLLPNFGDLNAYRNWPNVPTVDVLVGGTPCQSFSVAGLRKGLDDPRGNLALVYLGLADLLRPEWVVWENVAGVLSSNGGRDFGAFLGGLAELGYGFAYRVLDAQFIRTFRLPFAVPQRRRRVILVGYLGDWRPPAAVLFDRASLRGDPPPRREAGQGAAGRVGGGAAVGGIPDVSPALKARDHKGPSSDGDGDGAPILPVAFDTTQITSAANYSRPRPGDACHPLAAGAHAPAIAFAHQAGGKQTTLGFCDDGAVQTLGAHQTPAIAFSCKDHGGDATEGASPTLRAMGHGDSHPNAGGQLAVAFDLRGREGGAMPEGPHDTANLRAASGGSSRSYVASRWAVRRLTPRECERLQGFPDDWTNVPVGNKAAADGPRYKALGNSMATNVMEFIGERIQLVAEIIGRAGA